MLVQDRTISAAGLRPTGKPLPTTAAQRPADDHPSLPAIRAHAKAFLTIGVDRVAFPDRPSAVAEASWTRNAPLPEVGAMRGKSGAVAADFAKEHQRIRSDFPGLGETATRAMAQYNTILAHRAEFPRNGFEIRTPLEDGTILTATIPPLTVAGPQPSTASTFAPFPFAGPAQPSIAVSAAEAHYAEWA